MTTNLTKGTLIYLHGFNSTGESDKASAMKAEFGDVNVISPTLPVDPTEVVALIGTIVRSVKSYPIIFVGTSLGGFYANYFAQKYDCPGVLVNPATNPSRLLYTAIGPNKNYKSGETYDWKQEYVEKLGEMEKEVSMIHSGGLVNLFVARDDKVIDADETLRNYPHTAHTSITDTGGHRYSDKFGDVIERIKAILK